MPEEMFVQYLFRSDSRFPTPAEDPSQTAGKIFSPAVEQIVESILKLDGKFSTHLVLATDLPNADEIWPMGGFALELEGVSCDGWYTIHGLSRDMVVPSYIINPENESLSFQEAYSFGLEQPFPAIGCLSLEQVLTVLKQFSQTGRICKVAKWMPIKDVEMIDG